MRKIQYLKKIEDQQNQIVKIITETHLFLSNVTPIYEQLNFLRLENIFKFEVLKFIFNF